MCWNHTIYVTILIQFISHRAFGIADYFKQVAHDLCTSSMQIKTLQEAHHQKKAKENGVSSVTKAFILQVSQQDFLLKKTRKEEALNETELTTYCLFLHILLAYKEHVSY